MRRDQRPGVCGDASIQNIVVETVSCELPVQVPAYIQQAALERDQ